MAVSAVMAALPLMISLIVFGGRAMRWASSAWVMPRSCSASRRISPGATAQSGCQVSVGLFAMVINHLLDLDLGHSGPVAASIRAGGQRYIGGFENQPVRPPEVQGELSLPVRAQLVAVPGRAVHVSERRRALKGRQPPLEELPVVRSP